MQKVLINLLADAGILRYNSIAGNYTNFTQTKIWQTQRQWGVAPQKEKKYAVYEKMG